MNHPLADNMYDHDNIQGQTHDQNAQITSVQPSIDKDELRTQIVDMFVRFFDGQMRLADQLTNGSVSIAQALTGKETTTNYAKEVEALISAQINKTLDKLEKKGWKVPNCPRHDTNKKLSMNNPCYCNLFVIPISALNKLREELK